MFNKHFIFLFNSDLEDEVDSLQHFHTELIVSATVRCLKIINSSLQLPNSLPPGMSARFRVGTSLANALTVSTFHLCNCCLCICIFIIN